MFFHHIKSIQKTNQPCRLENLKPTPGALVPKLLPTPLASTSPPSPLNPNRLPLSQAPKPPRVPQAPTPPLEIISPFMSLIRGRGNATHEAAYIFKINTTLSVISTDNEGLMRRRTLRDISRNNDGRDIAS